MPAAAPSDARPARQQVARRIVRERALSAARPALPPQATRASVRIDGAVRHLDADLNGEFPRLIVPPSGTAEVAVAYAERAPDLSPEVAVQVEDGGALEDGAVARAYPLDDRGLARFRFVASAQAGHHRLTLRRGADVKTLDLWVEPAQTKEDKP